ncbi:MAG: hypothetical protein DRI69_08365, partial [Bacteroidetes bacterium]
MKQFLSLVAAGALGAVITIGAYRMTEMPKGQSAASGELMHTTGLRHVDSGKLGAKAGSVNRNGMHTASRSESDKGATVLHRSENDVGSEDTPESLSTKAIIPGAIDFTLAAEKAMPAVVQIIAMESEELATERRSKQQQNDPWSGFFDFGSNDFFS